MKKAIIIVGGLGLVGLGIGFYLYKTQNKLANKDFDALVNLSTNKGYDIFEGLSTTQLAKLKNNYLKKFNRAGHNDMITILGLGEKNMSASQKVKFWSYMEKLTGKKLGKG